MKNKQRDGVNSKTKPYEILVGLFIGVVIGALIVLILTDYVSVSLSVLVTITITALILLLAITLLSFLFKNVLLKAIFGVSANDISEIQNDIDQLFDHVKDGEIKKGKNNANSLVSKLSSWYGWLQYRRWMIFIIQSLFIALAGLIGSVLLQNQNSLILKQNNRLDQQTNLQEAERRSSLIYFFSTISEKIDEELKQDFNQNNKRDLSPQLIGNIAALSHRLKPYRFLENDTLIPSSLSPERGQLLTTLLYSELDSNSYDEIFKRASFEYSDLRNGVFSNMSGNPEDINVKSIYSGFFGPQYTFDTTFDQSQKYHMRFVNMTNAAANHSIFYNVDFSYSDLSNANFTSSKMTLSNLFFVKANNAVFDSAKLVKATLNGEFQKASFKGTDLRGANLAPNFFARNQAKIKIEEAENLNCVKVDHFVLDKLDTIFSETLNLLENKYEIVEGCNELTGIPYTVILDKEFFNKAQNELAKYNYSVERVNYEFLCGDPNRFEIRQDSKNNTIMRIGTW